MSMTQETISQENNGVTETNNHLSPSVNRVTVELDPIDFIEREQLEPGDPILPENFAYPVYNHVKQESIIFKTMDTMDKRFNTLFPRLMGRSSPLFNPDPFEPISSYKQRNRRYWSPEEIKQLSIDAFGLDCFDPEGIRLVVAPYEHNFKLFNAHGELRDDYHIGKVIKIGKQAFSTEKFIAGPPCTFNDYVHFKSMNVLTSRAMNGKTICVVEDVAILGILDDPAEYYKSKEFNKDNLSKFEKQIETLSYTDI